MRVRQGAGSRLDSATRDRSHAAPAALPDRFGRVATDLRVSLTDRCNLRCSYCMPAEGLDWLPDDEMLTDDEVVRLITDRRRAARHRARCGSPAASRCVRRGLVDIVAPHRGPRPRVETSLTTNALGPDPHRAGARATAGLDRVNVSLDTRPPRDLPRRSPAATGSTTWSPASRPPRAAGLGPVKVNAVLLRGVNDDQAPELLRWAIERGYDLRFIEQMPLDAQHGWSREEMVTADEIFDRARAPSSS